MDGGWTRSAAGKVRGRQRTFPVDDAEHRKLADGEPLTGPLASHPSGEAHDTDAKNARKAGNVRLYRLRVPHDLLHILSIAH